MADITIVNGVYKPTYNWGAPSCLNTAQFLSVDTILCLLVFRGGCLFELPSSLQQSGMGFPFQMGFISAGTMVSVPPLDIKIPQKG